MSLHKIGSERVAADAVLRNGRWGHWELEVMVTAVVDIYEGVGDEYVHRDSNACGSNERDDYHSTGHS